MISMGRPKRNLTASDLTHVENLLTKIGWKDYDGVVLQGLEMIGIVNKLMPNEYAFAESLIYGEQQDADTYIKVMEDIAYEVERLKIILDIEKSLVNM